MLSKRDSILMETYNSLLLLQVYSISCELVMPFTFTLNTTKYDAIFNFGGLQVH